MGSCASKTLEPSIVTDQLNPIIGYCQNKITQETFSNVPSGPRVWEPCFTEWYASKYMYLRSVPQNACTGHPCGCDTHLTRWGLMNSVRTDPKMSLFPYSTSVNSPALKIMQTCRRKGNALLQKSQESMNIYHWGEQKRTLLHTSLNLNLMGWARICSCLPVLTASFSWWLGILVLAVSVFQEEPSCHLESYIVDTSASPNLPALPETEVFQVVNTSGFLYLQHLLWLLLFYCSSPLHGFDLHSAHIGFAFYLGIWKRQVWGGGKSGCILRS